MDVACTDCQGSTPSLSTEFPLEHQSIESMREVCRETVDYLEDLPTYEEFFLRYLLPNRPCVLSSRATERWRSRTEWVTSQGTPDLDFLNKQYGSLTVPVADCSQEKFSSHPKTEMRFSDYIKYWREFIHNQHRGEKLLYLKDWHMARTCPDYQAYNTPVYFKSDWLNEFWDCRTDEGDDYRFVYMGPKGTWTPLHADVFRSYSWSANICGRKKWIFYPPGEEHCLTDIFGQLAFSITTSELNDESKFPKYKHLQHQIEVFQEEGEIIFVPSGWHHQVFNVEDTISINHNWMNGCNIDLCWRYISQCLLDVQREIADCGDMEGWHSQCQLILKASSGIDFVQFLRFLSTIAQHRVQALSDHSLQSSHFTSAHGDKADRLSDDNKTFVSTNDPGDMSVTSTACDNISSGQTTQMNSVDCEIKVKSPVQDGEMKLTDGDTNVLDNNVCPIEEKSTGQSFEIDSVAADESQSDILDLSSDLKYPYAHWRFCNVAHAKFDLERLEGIMKEILNLPLMMEIDVHTEITIAVDILKQIQSVIHL